MGGAYIDRVQHTMRGSMSAVAAHLGVVAVVWTLTASARACSGPGAEEAIFENGLIAACSLWTTPLIGAAFALWPRLRRPGWRRQWPFLVLFIAHPSWWISPLGGDCGYLLRDLSVASSVLTLVVAGLLYWRAHPRRVAVA